MKFKDAELVGVPSIVVVGKGLAAGTVEVKDRRTGERSQVVAPSPAVAADAIAELIGVPAPGR